MRAKGARLGHGTLMVPVRQGKKKKTALLSAPEHHSGAERADMAERRRHTAPPTHKGCRNGGRNGRCPIGNFFRGQSSEMKSSKTAHSSGLERQDAVRQGLFVQQIGTTRSVTDTQRWGRGRSCHQRLVTAAEEPSELQQVCRPPLLVLNLFF